MPEPYHLFDTAIGACGVAWSADGLTRLQLPEADRAATERRLRARQHGAAPADPPPQMKQAIGDIQSYLSGQRTDFSAIALDLQRASPFDRKVYEAARHIPWGETTSYGELARRAGCPGEAREVGQALSRNPVAIIIPCHRILAKGGKLGGFSAYGGTLTKEQLLALEGVDLQGDAPLLPGLLPVRERRR
ncbi:methylated-DNA-[protein]-cysteine S-methyltransferase [Rhizobiales bacterium GAS191]|nr:methylated-DNA-[protein]-cysteine S-methyltransferase [Rhizobiales bacterium GAS191]